MSKINYRRFKVWLDSKEFIAGGPGRQFKIVFEISHTFGGAPSFADISFYNLTEETAAKAFKTARAATATSPAVVGTNIQFAAGYADQIGIIFDGEIRQVLRERIGPDTITRVLARSDKTAENRDPVSFSLGPGTSAEDVIGTLAVKMGYHEVKLYGDFKSESSYTRGYTTSGDPLIALDALAKAHKFSYHINGSSMRIVKDGDATTDDVHIISQFTGMENIPEITNVGCDVTIRINPHIQIDDKFRVESKYKTFAFSSMYWMEVPESPGQGDYKIIQIQYSGDSWGDRWSQRLFGNSPLAG